MRHVRDMFVLVFGRMTFALVSLRFFVAKAAPGWRSGGETEQVVGESRKRCEGLSAAAPRWRLPNPDGCATLGVNKANCFWWGFTRQQLSGSE